MKYLEIGVKLLSALRIFGLLVISCDSSSNEEKRLYYSNGVLHKLISKKGANWEGPVWTYYPTGRLNSKAYWHNDMQHGPAYFYYPNGRLQEYSQWRMGKAQGQSLRYYRNGTLKRKVNFQAGVEVGNAILYDSTGKPQELQVYDGQGHLIWVTNYDRTGGMQTPIIDAPDTIKLGDSYQGCVHFGYPLIGKTTMLIGTLVKRIKTFERYHIKDTIAVVHPDQQGRFCFSYKPQPTKSGAYVFSYKFLQKSSLEDSLSVNYMTGTHLFYVRTDRDKK